jgi:hypothetical protein
VTRAVLAIALIVLGWPAATRGEVRRAVVASREPVLAGAPFGPAGAYEKLAGTLEFQYDPAHPANARIVDLDRAPRNARGLVEASADFMVLRPVHPPDRKGVALLEVSNRGGKALLSDFNRARPSLDPTAAEDFGDGLLMRQGLTLIWVGWQWDVPPRPGLLRLRAPVATDAGRPLEGLVRSDWTLDRATTTLPLGHRDQLAYPVLDPGHPDNVLTVRDGRLAPRRVVPRARWRFGREAGGSPVEDREHIYMAEGFQAGKIYELVYRARGPVVAGLGLAAVRDAIAYAKHDPACPFPAGRGLALGISQSGRFLRHFVYQGFNTDEAGRKAFDGMLVHTAGAGRGSFNHRFAQASRDAHRFSAFFYPTDLFPFSGRSQRDPETGVEDGLFAQTGRPDHLPKIFFTNTGYEYWGRAASLIHTSVDARADVPPLANERIYHLAGGQHFVGGFPPAAGTRLDGPAASPRDEPAAYRDNPLDFRVSLRALLVRLVEWVTDGREPPPSAYPTLAAGTLVTIDRLAFPAIPGVRAPRVIHQAHRVDYGPRWAEGIVSVEPPRVGASFPALVSQVDELGNEVAGIRNIELLIPLATYTPWSLRTAREGSAGELVDFFGTYVPLSRTEAERRRTGDPRPSLERRYAGRADYLGAVAAAAASLRAAGLLLAEDIADVLARAERQWDWIISR